MLQTCLIIISRYNMISVCMATHNGEKYIKEQIESILPQLSENDELIISDDGSSDRTLSIIRQYDDSRIKLLQYIQPVKFTDHFAPHRYASKNFENAIKHANGDYIFPCDQDDIWMPDKVSLCIKALENSILVKHSGVRITSEGHPMGKVSCSMPVSRHLLVNLYRLKIPGSHIAFRRELLKAALPFPFNTVSHDAWLGCLASCLGKCTSLDDELIQYRIHDNNVSIHKQNSIVTQISYRMDLLLQIIKRLSRRK